MSGPWEDYSTEQGPWSDYSASAQVAPTQAQPPAPKKTFAQRFKEAVMVPEADRQALVKERQAAGNEPVLGLNWSDIRAVPSEIGKEFISGAKGTVRDVGHIAEFDPHLGLGGNLVGKGLSLTGDVAGMAFSPLTGTADAIVGRPIEAATGIRRDIPGAITASLVPFGGAAKGTQAAGSVQNTLKAIAEASALEGNVAMKARRAGYVLHPAMYETGDARAAAMAGVSGKIKTQQRASVINQEVTNRLAAQSLGLARGTELTPAAFSKVRTAAGKSYKAVEDAIPTVLVDEKYLDDLVGLHGGNTEAAKIFPELHKHPGVEEIINTLSRPTEMPTKVVMEEIKNLRKTASDHFRGAPSTDNLALGFAKRDAAESLEDLLERNLSREGKGDLVSAFKSARQLIAKSHDVESATNKATGNVKAARLAALKSRGRPLSGELSDIADAALAFPKVMQSPERFGGDETFSALDLFAGTAAFMHNPKLALGILSRPLARGRVLSEPVQNRLARKTGMSLLRDFAQSAPKTRNYLLGVSERTSPFRRAPAFAGVNRLAQMAQEPDEQ